MRKIKRYTEIDSKTSVSIVVSNGQNSDMSLRELANFHFLVE